MASSSFLVPPSVLRALTQLVQWCSVALRSADAASPGLAEGANVRRTRAILSLACVSMMACVQSAPRSLTSASADTTDTKASLLAADAALAENAERHGVRALIGTAAPGAAILIAGHPILRADAATDALHARYGAPSAYSWQPRHALASADGRFGCTVGTARYRDSVGTRRGVYTTCWERQANGEWRIVALQRSEAPSLPDTATWREPPRPHSATRSLGGTPLRAAQDADAAFARYALGTGGPGPAFARYAAEDGILLAPPDFPRGPAAIEAGFARFPTDKFLIWEPMREFGGGSGGLAVTVGHAFRRARDGSGPMEGKSKYLTIWRQRADGGWEYVLDFGTSRP